MSVDVSFSQLAFNRRKPHHNWPELDPSTQNLCVAQF